MANVNRAIHFSQIHEILKQFLLSCFRNGCILYFCKHHVSIDLAHFRLQVDEHYTSKKSAISSCSLPFVHILVFKHVSFAKRSSRVFMPTIKIGRVPNSLHHKTSSITARLKTVANEVKYLHSVSPANATDLQGFSI